MGKNPFYKIYYIIIQQKKMEVEPYDKNMCRFERFDFDNASRIVVDNVGNVYENTIKNIMVKKK
jgi:hypothetical protein